MSFLAYRTGSHDDFLLLGQRLYQHSITNSAKHSSKTYRMLICLNVADERLKLRSTPYFVAVLNFFLFQEYFVDLYENLYPGRIIVRVQAHDRDSGSYGRLRYSLSVLNNKPLIRTLLEVDPVTGDVILKETLDRETHNK